jgi:hypothetical protein
MGWSPCAKIGDGSASSASCLRGRILVSRFPERSAGVWTRRRAAGSASPRRSRRPSSSLMSAVFRKTFSRCEVFAGPKTDPHSIGFCAALRSITVAGWSGSSKLSTIRCSAATIMPSVRRWGAISTPNFAQNSRRRKCSHLAYSAASICQIAARNFLRGGLRVPSSRPQAATARSIISASMPVSRCRCGARKAGFTPTIRAAGSSGTAATTWAAACRKRTHVRSSAGKRSDGTSRRSSSTASLATRCVDRVNAKLCCTGPMTAAKFKVNEGLLLAHRFRSRHCSITADVEGRTDLSRTCRYGSVPPSGRAANCSLDHLVGAAEQVQRERNTERLGGGFEVEILFKADPGAGGAWCT